MITNIENVYVGSVDDIDDEFINNNNIMIIVIVGKGLSHYYNFFSKKYSINGLFYFPLEDWNNEENIFFAKSIVQSVVGYHEWQVDGEEKDFNILFCCGAGLSRSPYIASMFLEENYGEKMIDYYYKFKEQNKAIKSIFIE